MRKSSRESRLVLALAALSALVPAAAAVAQAITEFSTTTATSRPIAITAGPDGNLWFTEQSASKIGKITPAGVITEYPTLTIGAPTGIAAGPDGNLWFVEQAANRIGRITTAGVVTEFLIPTVSAECVGITAGPDGALWFTENTANKIGRITTAGVITEFPLPNPSVGPHPTGIVTGSDGALWFAEYGGVGYSAIGRITTAGVITEFPIIPGSRPVWLTAGPDAAIWFAESGGAAIGRMTTAGVRTEFPVPVPFASPIGITTGPDNALWFTDGFKHIGRLTTAGAFTALTTPTNNSAPQTIVSGSDSALWFTEYEVDKIGRSSVDVLAATSILPASGPAAGASGVTLAGAHFDPAASVTVGGTAASSVVVGSANQITLDVPALAPGGLFDLTVTNPDATTSTLPKGWFADFLDVPGGSGVHSFVEKLVRHQVTAGCSGGNYCPGSPVTRAQMAVFLLRSNDGPVYTPPACSAPTFADVPCSSGFAIWVDELAARGVTAGCGGGNYCPNDPVTRAQMAVFLLVTHDGSGYVPPACVTPTFGDVPCSSGFARWVDELALRGITIGCGGGNYCPNNPVTRGQMAVFLVTTFGLP